MSQNPFQSPDHFHQAFIRGLAELLEDDGLGGHILVLANACFDPEVYQLLKKRLAQRFSQLANRCRDACREGRALSDAADDQLVFFKLMSIGFEQIQLTEKRQVEGWEVQFNPLRAMRPKRMTQLAVQSISAPFDICGFNFNLPFLQRETFWSGRLNRLSVDFLYNKFPFVEQHALLVPSREQREAQFLSLPYHRYVWELADQLGDNLPGASFAYNSYGAYASVNHLHFQFFIRPQPLPVAMTHWSHNGGAQVYPTPCRVFHSVLESWEYIRALHQANKAYNLLYRPGKLYCLPRAKQGSYTHSAWTGGYAWYEMTGGVTAFNRADYERLDGRTISAELAQVGKS